MNDTREAAIEAAWQAQAYLGYFDKEKHTDR